MVVSKVCTYVKVFPGGSEVKASACSAGDLGSIPESGRCPGEGNGNPLQYSCLENPMEGGAWQATVHGVAKSRTPLSNFTSHTSLQSTQVQTIVHILSNSRAIKTLNIYQLYFNKTVFNHLLSPRTIQSHDIILGIRMYWRYLLSVSMSSYFFAISSSAFLLKNGSSQASSLLGALIFLLYMISLHGFVVS